MAAAAKGTTAKKAAAPKTAAASKKAAAATAKSAVPKPPKTTATNNNGPPPAEGSNTLNYALLGLAAAGVVGYAGYEYRHDIRTVAGRLWRAVRRKNDEATLQTD